MKKVIKLTESDLIRIVKRVLEEQSVVGTIKDGVPIIFHNIGGQVFADPYNNIKGGSRIAWVKRA
jgi:hypothetical protein